ncbi:hypothetical protein BDP27DRAFT_296295 [Rhodocollybia butyracea]|uniref:Uncharacterized protein n=1 Tax=Rhodocollybia butyracea TaxID=206335 RepID=A0A9P5PF49_9AGAR|nr:hypothetical protein BDP27DRAFT_296295 [Rhodocollybia butyracea]
MPPCGLTCDYKFRHFEIFLSSFFCSLPVYYYYYYCHLNALSILDICSSKLQLLLCPPQIRDLRMNSLSWAFPSSVDLVACRYASMPHSTLFINSCTSKVSYLNLFFSAIVRFSISHAACFSVISSMSQYMYDVVCM